MDTSFAHQQNSRCADTKASALGISGVPVSSNPRGGIVTPTLPAKDQSCFIALSSAS